MKIVFFSNNIQNAIHFRLPLINFLNKKKHKIVLITFEKKNLKIKKDLKAYFYKIYYLNEKKINFISLIKSIYKVFNILNFVNPKIILSFTLQANIISAILSNLINLKFIINVTGLGSYFISSNKYLSCILKLFLKSGKNFIFQNRYDKEFFFKKSIIKKKKIFIIPSLGIKTLKKKKKYKNKKSTNFLMISRIIKDKGVIEYLNSSNYFSDDKNIKFYLAGNLDQSNPSKIKKNEFKNLLELSNVKYLGHITNIHKIMNKYDCIVLPSYREGLSKTLLEAGVSGVPSITTDVPGCKDIIKNKVNGLICKPKSVKSLVNSINIFLNLNYKEKKMLSEKSVEIIKRKFNQDKILKNYYKKIINVSK